MGIGIEKINMYGGSLALDIVKLAEARGRDGNYFKNDLMIEKKSQNVDYEDVITLAVNAAKPILSDEDKKDIGLCIFATESGLDFCKSNSTYVFKYLGLNPSLWTFEIKNACYAATCGLDVAANWIMSGAGKGKKALIVSGDINYENPGRRGEEVPGVGAVAMLVSETPKVIEFETDIRGYHTFECVDYARPTMNYDIINGEESLYAYLECFEGAFEDFKKKKGDIDLNEYFKRIVCHTPFGGLVKMGYDNLLRSNYPNLKKKERAAQFMERVEKSLRVSKVVGNTYSCALYMSLISLLLEDDDIEPGDRIGMYSYGSGSCAEFYSAILLPGAKEYVRSLGIRERLDSRYELSIEEFDHIAHKQASNAAQDTFETDLSYPDGLYEKYYKDKGMLILRGSKNFIRKYEWS